MAKPRKENLSKAKAIMTAKSNMKLKSDAEMPPDKRLKEHQSAKRIQAAQVDHEHMTQIEEARDFIEKWKSR